MRFFFLPALIFGCQQNALQTDVALQAETQSFLDSCSAQYLHAYQHDANVLWQAQYADSLPVSSLDGFFASGVGERAKSMLKQSNRLLLAQNRQLEWLVFQSAFYPSTLRDSTATMRQLTVKRVGMLAQQMAGARDGCGWNCLDMLFRQTDAERMRLQQWITAQQYWGREPDALIRIARLRNLHAEKAQYPNFMAYSLRASYANEEQAQAQLKKLLQEIRPLFELLHTHARSSMAAKFGQGIPLMLPAHWLGNLQGNAWTYAHYQPLADSVVRLGASYPQSLAKEFFAQHGFAPLPESYLKPTGAQVPIKAWHIDKEQDIRLTWSPQPGIKSYFELVEAYTDAYGFDAYSNSDVPPMLREGTVPALLPAWRIALRNQATEWGWRQFSPADSVLSNDYLLSEALAWIPMLVFQAGVVNQFEQDLYAGRLNTRNISDRWWQLMRQYMGVVPPDGAKSYCSPAAYDFLYQSPGNALASSQSIVLAYQLQGLFRQQQPARLFRQTLYAGKLLKWEDVRPLPQGELLQTEALLKRYQVMMGWLKGKHFNQSSTLPSW